MRGWWVWIAFAAAFFLWPDELGAMDLAGEIALVLGIALLATPFLVYRAILRSLPEQVEVVPAGPRDVPPQVYDLVRQYEDLGFERVLGPLRVHLPHPAVLVPLMHRAGAMYATVYRIEAGAASKTAYDVVSMLDAADAALTTAMDHGAGALPAAPGSLRQIFAGASPAEMVERHEEALRFLERQRLARLAVADSALVHLLKRSFEIQRRTFLQARVTNTLVALGRTLSKRNPHMGPLAAQGGIEERLAKLPRTRGARRPSARAPARPL